MADYQGLSKSLTQRINIIYSKAKQDLREELQGLIDRFEKQTERIQNQLDAGNISEEEAKTALLKLFQAVDWNKYTDGLYEANKAAKDEIQQQIPGTIADGINRECYEIEMDMGEDAGLVPWDAEDIAAWLEENPNVFPESQVDEEKDKDWNSGNLMRTFTTAVLVGVGVWKLADYVSDNVTKRNRTSMMQSAWNTLSGAFGSGKQTGMQCAQDKGIEMQKEWLATLDFKTRDAHRELDRQKVPIDKPYTYGNDTIRFPRDPQAKAYLRCNCRCADRHINPHWANPLFRKENIKNGEGEKPIIQDMTYREWYQMKVEQLGEDTIKETVAEMKREQNRKYYRRRKQREKAEAAE